MHIGLAIPVLGFLSAQTCRPQRQRPICVGQSGQPSFHILFLVEPRMEQITKLSTTKGLCCTPLTIWRLYVHSTTNKQTNTHTPCVPEFCSKYKRSVSADDKSLPHLTPPLLWKTNMNMNPWRINGQKEQPTELDNSIVRRRIRPFEKWERVPRTVFGVWKF